MGKPDYLPCVGLLLAAGIPKVGPQSVADLPDWAANSLHQLNILLSCHTNTAMAIKLALF